ncbi:UNVERIFIED_CONTAM: hypothetical protein HDU68_001456 [Siphonaria sp. JEL0065]|nr:hypothetical protein HDU68_001456 [Siphonaria sp. JEL0065]
MTPSNQSIELQKLYESYSAKNPSRPLLCPSPIDLGDGLILRRCQQSDRNELAAFNARIHFPAVGRYTLDAFDGDLNEGLGLRHPTFNVDCITVVVDSKKEATGNSIVSSVFSIPQIWFYGTPDASASTQEEAIKSYIPLVVTRPEAVGTDEGYRGSALIKKHMDVHHKWAQDLNSSIQFIGGMPLYYSRFGYDLAPPRMGGFSGNKETISVLITAYKQKLEKDSSLPRLAFRRATSADASFLARLVRINFGKREGVWTDIPEQYWVDLFDTRQRGSLSSHEVFVLGRLGSDSSLERKTVGFVQLNSMSGHVSIFEVDQDVVSWTDATTVLFEWLQEYQLRHAANKKEITRAPLILPSSQTSELPPLTQPSAINVPSEILPEDWAFKLLLGASHPCYTSIPKTTTIPIEIKPYYWYTRISHLPSFLQKITPVLNHRLKTSLTFSQFTGTIAIMFSFHSAAGNVPILEIKNGQLETVKEADASWSRQDLVTKGRVGYLAMCHGTSWMRMVLGHRTASEIQENGDLVVLDQSVVQVLDVLFPRMRVDNIVGLD